LRRASLWVCGDRTSRAGVSVTKWHNRCVPMGECEGRAARRDLRRDRTKGDAMKVILGVDSSTFSEAAIHHVREAPWPKGTSVMVISAVEPVFIAPGEALATQAIANYIEQQEAFHKHLADEAADRLRGAGLDARGTVKRGDPRIVLEETAKAEQADLVVVGSHGRSGIQRLLLGSVAAHVVTHAPCPVLVVKTPAWKKEAMKPEHAAAAAS
jgi:nucleotide-binding universal stress UspA family protein